MEQGFTGTSSEGPRSIGWIGAGFAVVGLSLAACQDPNAGGAPTRWAKQGSGHDAIERLPSIPPRPETLAAGTVLEAAKEHFAPLPEAAESPMNPMTEEKLTLGRMLYSDPRLSKGNDLSCASCHDLAGYGVDAREQDGKPMRTALAHGGEGEGRNAPSIYNAALHVAQLWDARAPSVEAIARGPAPETDMDIAALQASPGYVQAFAAAFPDDSDPVSYNNVALAIGAFARQLMTPGPFDDFLSGNLTALTEQQMQGLDSFMSLGCIQCHSGATVGGQDLKKLGLAKPWEGLKDEGRGALTKSEDDKYVFKVPSLRNVTKTGPYLHDGSVDTLEEMVQKMATHQLGKGDLPPDQLAALVAFLGALEGRLPDEYIAKPTLPSEAPARRAAPLKPAEPDGDNEDEPDEPDPA